MRPFTKRLSIPVALAALATSTAFAEIELTKGLSISGYVVGSSVATRTSYDWPAIFGDSTPKAREVFGLSSEHDSDTATEIEAYKLQANGRYGRFSATASIFSYGTESGSGYDYSPVLLDAHATCDLGGGFSLTAGKFQSWLGYESFDAVGLNQLTYANENLLAAQPYLYIWGYLIETGDIVFAEKVDMTPIVARTGLHIDPMFGAPTPNYHSGLKLERQRETYSFGVAALDSVYGPAYYRGDGDFDNGLGGEAYVSYKGLKNLTFFASLAYEHQRIGHLTEADDPSLRAKYLTADFWVEYTLGKTSLVAEFCQARTHVSRDPAISTTYESYFWALAARHAFTPKWALTGRLSSTAADMGGGLVYYQLPLRAYRYTVAPSYAVCRYLDLVAEYSYTDYRNGLLDSAHYLGVQARVKF
jgi:hypothetical protein